MRAIAAILTLLAGCATPDVTWRGRALDDLVLELGRPARMHLITSWDPAAPAQLEERMVLRYESAPCPTWFLVRDNTVIDGGCCTPERCYTFDR